MKAYYYSYEIEYIFLRGRVKFPTDGDNLELKSVTHIFCGWPSASLGPTV